MKRLFSRLYNQLSKEITQFKNTTMQTQALVSRKDLSIWKALQNKSMRDFMLNRPKEDILLSFTPNMNRQNTTLESQMVKNTSILSTEKGYTLSGLKDLPKEYFLGDIMFKEIYKKHVSIQFAHLLFIMGRYEMNNDEAVLKNALKLFSSIIPCFHQITDYKQFREVYLSKYMGNLQHLLAYFFRNKKFNIHLFQKYLLNNIDYNMFKHGTISNVIEIVVLKTTLNSALDNNSFVAINHESIFLAESASIYGYDREISQLIAGQQNVDFIGVRAIADAKGNVELVLCYKDVKMYESGALKGRITLKPDLIYNERYLKEYTSKNISALKKIIEENTLDTNHPCVVLLKDLEIQNKKIKEIVTNAFKNKIGDFIDKEYIIEIQQQLNIFNTFILEGMKNPEIVKIVNLGISADPGRDHEFIEFYAKYLRNSVENAAKNFDDEGFSKLHSSSITAENEAFVRQTQKQFTQFFPEQLENGFRMKESVMKALEYLDTK